MKTKTQHRAKSAPVKIVVATPKPAKAKKCRAKDVGHRSCDCGGEYCGENAAGR